VPGKSTDNLRVSYAAQENESSVYKHGSANASVTNRCSGNSRFRTRDANVTHARDNFNDVNGSLSLQYSTAKHTDGMVFSASVVQ
jgi:hypothetical protein